MTGEHVSFKGNFLYREPDPDPAPPTPEISSIPRELLEALQGFFRGVPVVFRDEGGEIDRRRIKSVTIDETGMDFTLGESIEQPAGVFTTVAELSPDILPLTRKDPTK